MFTALGVLQRDAPSLKPSNKGADPSAPIPLLLIDDFTKEIGILSQDIDRLVHEVASNSSNSETQDSWPSEQEWKLAIKRKQQSIKELENERHLLMQRYQNIMDAFISLSK